MAIMTETGRLFGRYSPEQAATEVRVRRMNAASWEETTKGWEQKLQHHPAIQRTVKAHWGLLRDYHEAVSRDYAAGNGTENADKFRMLMIDETSIYYVTPGERSKLRTPMKMVRESVTHTPETPLPPSRGWAKHVRREKSANHT